MLSDGKSFNAICKDTHSSKTTVSNYKKLVEGTKLPYVELLEKSDSELEQLLSSQLSKPSEDARKAPLQEMMPEIIKRLSKRYANIQLVYEEFYLKQEGEHYGYTQFKNYVQSYVEAHSANSTSKCKITKCFCKSTPLVLRNSISFLVSH